MPSTRGSNTTDSDSLKLNLGEKKRRFNTLKNSLASYQSQINRLKPQPNPISLESLTHHQESYSHRIEQRNYYFNLFLYFLAASVITAALYFAYVYFMAFLLFASLPHCITGLVAMDFFNPLFLLITVPALLPIGTIVGTLVTGIMSLTYGCMACSDSNEITHLVAQQTAHDLQQDEHKKLILSKDDCQEEIEEISAEIRQLEEAIVRVERKPNDQSRTASADTIHFDDAGPDDVEFDSIASYTP